MRLKNLEQKLKRIMSASGGLGPLQMVSEPDTRRYTSKKAEHQKGWTRGSVPIRTLGPKGVNWRDPTSIREGNEFQ